jgi:hypothetical protein
MSLYTKSSSTIVNINALLSWLYTFLSPSHTTILKNTRRHLHNNRITQKKKETHKTTQDIADTERLWTQIDTDIAMGTVAES